MECHFISLNRLWLIRPKIPNQISKLTVEQSMIGGFKLLATDWTFIAGIDASGTHPFICRQPVDTSPPCKDFNLCTKVEEPQILSERFEWVSF